MEFYKSLSCEEKIANELVNMVQEGMRSLSLAEQDKRLTDFCESASASLHTPTKPSE